MPTHKDLKPIRLRIASVLFIAQSFYSASFIAAFTLSPIIAVALSGNPTAAGFPNTVGLIGRAAFAYPFGYLMDRLGRRLALSGGYILAVIGATIAIFAIINNSFIGFMLGALFSGMSRTASDQSRYVAAEVYPTTRRAKVIGMIVAAGTIGAIFGPLMVAPSGRLIKMQDWGLETQVATWIGPFAFAAIAILVGASIVFLFLRPDPLEIGRLVATTEAAEDANSLEASQSARTMGQVFSAPLVQLAVLSMTLGYFVMTFLMVITPVHMNNNGYSTGIISGVIMAHTLGMFGLSGFTGSLIDRFGRIPMVYAGCAILMSSAIIAPLSLKYPLIGLALFLLGLGWNFTFVAGSSLLSNSVNTLERARAQAIGGMIVAISASSASFSVGYVFKQGDYLLVSIIGFSIASLLVILTILLTQRAKAQNPPPDTAF